MKLSPISTYHAAFCSSALDCTVLPWKKRRGVGSANASGTFLIRCTRECGRRGFGRLFVNAFVLPLMALNHNCRAVMLLVVTVVQVRLQLLPSLCLAPLSLAQSLMRMLHSPPFGWPNYPVTYLSISLSHFNF